MLKAGVSYKNCKSDRQSFDIIFTAYMFTWNSLGFQNLLEDENIDITIEKKVKRLRDTLASPDFLYWLDDFIDVALKCKRHDILEHSIECLVNLSSEIQCVATRTLLHLFICGFFLKHPYNKEGLLENFDGFFENFEKLVNGTDSISQDLKDHFIRSFPKLKLLGKSLNKPDSIQQMCRTIKLLSRLWPYGCKRISTGIVDISLNISKDYVYEALELVEIANEVSGNDSEQLLSISTCVYNIGAKYFNEKDFQMANEFLRSAEKSLILSLNNDKDCKSWMSFRKVLHFH